MASQSTVVRVNGNLLIAAALQQRFVQVPLDECAEGAAVQVMQKYSVPTSAACRTSGRAQDVEGAF
jgi:hypothetical protein